MILRKTLIFIFLALFLLNTSISKVEAENLVVQKSQEITIEIKKIDPRAVILRKYFAKYNSPLENYAQDFVDAADKYGVDWKLVPAIAGVESTFGKAIPGGFNGWGWGVYGSQAIYFRSWREGIFTVTEGLKYNYIDRGLVTPYLMNRVYAASPAWGWKVAYFMNDLEMFAKENNLEGRGFLDKVNFVEAKVANSSAKLAYSIY